MENDNIIILNDENGIETEFELLDLIIFNGNEYVVLLPVEENTEVAEVVILILESINEESESYTSLEDENTLQAVFDIFKEKFKDEFNFID